MTQPDASAKRWIRKETLGGLLLLLATAFALLWANSPFAASYAAFWNAPVGLRLGPETFDVSLRHVIDDGLMTLFFLLVGCELKREISEGVLASRRKIRLPLAAALGGMIVPALLYVGVICAKGAADPALLRGWAIPTATDIAFALGFLSFLGSRIPSGLKVFLAALAVIDDLGAILLIGLFYSSSIGLAGLGAAVFLLVCLAAMARHRVVSLKPYLALGVVLWAAVLQSGVHATLSGVLLAAFLPLRVTLPNGTVRKPLVTLEHALHPFVSFFVMPLFALANAGVSLHGMGFASLAEPLPLAIVVGLFVGKQLGVFGAAKIALRSGFAEASADISTGQLYGAALLCGVGFTMSLFIGVLAFPGEEALSAVRLGVLTGSLLSALAGCLVLSIKGKKKAF